jgi:hypothetical protein
LIEISDVSHRPAELATILNVSIKTTLQRADLGMVFDRSVTIQEQDPDGAPIRSPIIVASCPNCDIRHAVTVEIAQGGNTRSKAIEIIEVSLEITLSGADFLLGLDCAIRFEKENPDSSHTCGLSSPWIASSIGISESSDYDVRYAIPIKIPQILDRAPKPGANSQISTEHTVRCADLLLLLDRAVRTEKKDPYSAVETVCVREISVSNSDIDHSVSIQIAETCNRVAPLGSDLALQTTLRPADLLRWDDLARDALRQEQYDSEAYVEVAEHVTD